MSAAGIRLTPGSPNPEYSLEVRRIIVRGALRGTCVPSNDSIQRAWTPLQLALARGRVCPNDREYPMRYL
jgi:hypothetical protein